MTRLPSLIAGRYEVSPLNGGGMGTLWLGYDTVLDREVAIKQIRDDEAFSSSHRRELADRFRREARITAKIEHPGVPAVYDAQIDRADDGVERLYFVMQLVRGITLADLIAERGALPTSWAVAIAAQICSVLAQAHLVPVVHRDLKPSNIMISDGGHVKVLDFGVAAVLDRDVTQLTRTGSLVGSRDYMSPEQFRGAPVSPRSDLYALGCLLHEMLTGRRVFDGPDDPALQHVHEPPIPLSVLCDGLEEPIERLVLDLLRKAPEDRPGSAAAVYGRLLPYLPQPDPTPTSTDLGPSGTRLLDPTRPFRCPLAPRQQPLARELRAAGASADWPSPDEGGSSATPNGVASSVPQQSIDELAGVMRKFDALFEQERFSQAAGLLEASIPALSRSLGSEHVRVLELRKDRAAALFLSGDCGRALPMFAELSESYDRQLSGGREALECRLQAAYCHATLGDGEAAISGFRAVLAQVRGTGQGSSPIAVEARRQIALILLTEQRPGEALSVLNSLHADLVRVHGDHSPETLEVEELLRRIDRTEGESGR